MIFTASYKGFLWKLTASHSHEILPALYNSPNIPYPEVHITSPSLQTYVWIQFTPTNLFLGYMYILIPSSHPPLFFMLSPPTYMCCMHAHHVLLDLITPIFGEKYKWWNLSCNTVSSYQPQLLPSHVSEPYLRHFQYVMPSIKYYNHIKKWWKC